MDRSRSDQIAVSSATVTVESTVWAWDNGSDDSLDLYYASPLHFLDRTNDVLFL